MSTTANIDFFGIEICVGSDGMPKEVLPEMRLLKDKVYRLQAAHTLTERQAAILVLDALGIYDQEVVGWVSPGSYSYPSHRYVVNKDETKEVTG